MSLIPIQRHPEPRQLRVFALLWLLLLAAAGVETLRRGGAWSLAVALWAVALAVPLAAWLYPPAARWVYVGLSYATWPIGWLLSQLLLASVYYLLLTPLGWALRLAGRDPLERRFEPGRESYWQPRAAVRERERYFRQF